MTKEEVQLYAFQMIALAGEATDFYFRAIAEFKKENNELSLELFENGNERLVECHQIQTDLIHKESQGEDIPYSLIMTHAQDHFTGATNWKSFARLIIGI